MAEKIKDKTEKLVLPILEDMHLELVEVEFKKEGKNWFLRVFIDGENGVDLEDCGKVSERLSEKLDEEDPIKQAYYLEVSSPGAERPLKNERDFSRAVNKHVYVTTYEPVEGDKAFEGKLVSFQNGYLTIERKEKQKIKAVDIPYDKVAKARLAIVF